MLFLGVLPRLNFLVGCFVALEFCWCEFCHVKILFPLGFITFEFAGLVFCRVGIFLLGVLSALILCLAVLSHRNIFLGYFVKLRFYSYEFCHVLQRRSFVPRSFVTLEFRCWCFVFFRQNFVPGFLQFFFRGGRWNFVVENFLKFGFCF